MKKKEFFQLLGEIDVITAQDVNLWSESDRTKFVNLAYTWVKSYFWKVKETFTKEEIEDITQNIMATVWVSLSTYQFDRTAGKFSGYMTNIIKWEISNWFRYHGRAKRKADVISLSDLAGTNFSELEQEGIDYNRNSNEQISDNGKSARETEFNVMLSEVKENLSDLEFKIWELLQKNYTYREMKLILDCSWYDFWKALKNVKPKVKEIICA